MQLPDWIQLLWIFCRTQNHFCLTKQNGNPFKHPGIVPTCNKCPRRIHQVWHENGWIQSMETSGNCQWKKVKYIVGHSLSLTYLIYTWVHSSKSFRVFIRHLGWKLLLFKWKQFKKPYNVLTSNHFTCLGIILSVPQPALHHSTVRLFYMTQEVTTAN